MLPSSSKTVSMMVKVFSGPSTQPRVISVPPVRSSEHEAQSAPSISGEMTTGVSSNKNNKLSPRGVAAPVVMRVLSGSNSVHPAESKRGVLKHVAEKQCVFPKFGQQCAIERGNKCSLNQEIQGTRGVTNKQIDVLFQYLKDLQARKINKELVDILNSVDGGVCLTRAEWLKFFNNLMVRTRKRLKESKRGKGLPELPYMVEKFPYAVEKLAERLGYLHQSFESGTSQVKKKRNRLRSSEFIDEHKEEKMKQFEELSPDVDHDSNSLAACKIELIEEPNKHNLGMVLKQESGISEPYVPIDEQPHRSTPNRAPVSASQMALLVETMELNQKLVGGSLSTKGRHVPREVSSWIRCAYRLNRLPGPKLTPGMWRNVWMHVKSVVKSKMAAGRRCVGAKPSHLRLSKLDLRVANILKLQQKTQVKEEMKNVWQAPKVARLLRSARDKKQLTLPRPSELRECRACGTNVNLMHIFTSRDGRSIQLDMLEYCNIMAKQNDGLPPWLCASCLELLRGAIRLREMCHASQMRLLGRDNRRRVKREQHDSECSDSLKTDESSVKVEVAIKNEPFERNSLVESNDAGLKDIQEVKLEVELEVELEPEVELELEEWNANYIEDEPLRRGEDWWGVYARHVCEFCDTPLRSRTRAHMSGACTSRLPPPPPPRTPPDAPKKWPRVVCHLCGEIRASMNFKNHLATQHAEDGVGFRFKCKSCPYSSRIKGQMVTHVRTVHLGIKPHMCPQCGQKFSSTSNLKWHNTRHHSAPVEIQCPQCDTVCTNKRYLAKHIIAVHESEPSGCDICGKTYKSRRHMTKHKRKVHQVNTSSLYPQLAKAVCFKAENQKKTDDRLLPEELESFGFS